MNGSSCTVSRHYDVVSCDYGRHRSVLIHAQNRSIADTSHRRVYPKVSGLSHNEINNNKHSLRNNTKGCDGKTHSTDSQNSDKTAHSGRELYHLQFSFQPASPETFGYTLVWRNVLMLRHRNY
jgi:hypothetical protein